MHRGNFLGLSVSICAAAAILIIAYFIWPDSEVTVWEAVGEDNELVRTEGTQPLEIEVVPVDVPVGTCASRLSIVIETQYPNLLAELALRLENPETEEMSLRFVQKTDHPMWGKSGWRLSVRSKFLKTYPAPKPCLNREPPI